MESPTRPSRITVLFIYIKRILRWRRNSYPLLSVDAFVDLSDYVAFPPIYRRRLRQKKMNKAKIIFCPSEKLQDFLDENFDQINAKVIIAGNSDYEFHNPIRNVPSSVNLLLLQNSLISENEKIFTLPIGVENLRWGVNGHPKLMEFNSKNNAKRGILIGPFSNTHMVRVELLAKLKAPDASLNESNEIVISRIKPRKYKKIMLSFKFVACVRGNGIDTHRLWETLYRGRIPLVESSKWLDSLKYLELPIIEVKNWSVDELNRIAETQEARFFDPSDIEVLWMPYWEKFIKSYL